MIVVATDDFEVYHELVDELRGREEAVSSVQPDEPIPRNASVILTGPDDVILTDEVPVIRTDAEDSRRAVERALTTLRGPSGRRIVGVDPGDRPGIAVCAGPTVISAFHVPLADAPTVIREEVVGHDDAIVRIGDGARLAGASIINALEDVSVELVDETGTTPSLGTGARGMGDVLAAVNVARMAGVPIERRDIEPTDGELTAIKERVRERSPENRTIDSGLARRVATGELTIEEALETHQRR